MGREVNNPDGNQVPYIPFVTQLFYYSLDTYTKKNSTKWRKLVNKGGFHGMRGCHYARQ